MQIFSAPVVRIYYWCGPYEERAQDDILMWGHYFAIFQVQKIWFSTNSITIRFWKISKSVLLLLQKLNWTLFLCVVMFLGKYAIRTIKKTRNCNRFSPCCFHADVPPLVCRTAVHCQGLHSWVMAKLYMAKSFRCTTCTNCVPNFSSASFIWQKASYNKVVHTQTRAHTHKRKKKHGSWAWHIYPFYIQSFFCIFS